MNKTTLKLVLEAREKFTKFEPENRTSVTVAGFCRKNGSFGRNNNTYCHAGLREYGEVGDLAIFTRHQGPTGPDKTIDLFYSYLLYESPWSGLFVKPSVVDVVQDGKDKGFIIDTNNPNNLTTQACFASRMATENKMKLVSFYDLYHLFSNKDLAFLVSFFIAKSGEGFVVSGDYYGHTHMPDGLSKDYVKNFMSHSPRKDELCIDNPIHSRSVNNSFGAGGEDLLRYLQKFAPVVTTESGLNIFDTKPKKVVSAKEFTKKDFPALVAYVEKEFM
ncbi:MAG: hypothetical protein GQ574_14775 [Crocinitomix sp.]|nr:hypothetical protein [Crocinitomix sp.]